MTLSYEEARRHQRDLAKIANFADSFVRIPFTRVGAGADAATGLAPGIGDALGMVIFAFVFTKARRLGLSAKQVIILILYAIADVLIGLVPLAGDVADVFSRPSRHALKMVNDHLAETHGVIERVHVDKPFLDEFLEGKRASGSRLWADARVGWIVLHLPDLLGIAALIIFANAVVQLVTGVAALFGRLF